MGPLVQRESFEMETHLVLATMSSWFPWALGRWAGKQVRAGAEGLAHLPQGGVGITELWV